MEPDINNMSMVRVETIYKLAIVTLNHIGAYVYIYIYIVLNTIKIMIQGNNVKAVNKGSDISFSFLMLLLYFPLLVVFVEGLSLQLMIYQFRILLVIFALLIAYTH